MVNFNELAEPFDPQRVHWRVGKVFDDGTGIVLAYLDARDVMGRLDEVCGPENWEDRYEETGSGRVICTIGIRCGKDRHYVEKSDGAGDTGFEGAKGGISDAFKRAAVKWGIGRYLYECKAPKIELYKGKYLPNNFDGAQYLMSFSSKQMKTRCWKALRDAASENDAGKARETWDELSNEQRQEVWRDFSSGVRSAIKELLDSTEVKKDE